MSLYFLCSWLQIAIISSQRWIVPQVAGTQSTLLVPQLGYAGSLFCFCNRSHSLPCLCIESVNTSQPWHLKCKLHFSFKQQLCRKQPVMLIPVDNFRSKLSKLPSLCNSLPGRQKKDCGQYLTHHSLQILPPVSTSAVPTGGKGKWALHPLPINLS